MTQRYAGDITSREAWDMLQQDTEAVLVDVRSEAEWRYVGVPDLASLDKKTVFVCWQTYPNMDRNSNFLADVAASGVGPDRKVLLLCRSGVRSRDAAIALTASGYQACFNVAGGFEGAHDEGRHRGATDGWKAAGLPWWQE
ncbi:MAG: rhodanese-like domain-containing protein [Alphaproteobacteria bacterium]